MAPVEIVLPPPLIIFPSACEVSELETGLCPIHVILGAMYVGKHDSFANLTEQKPAFVHKSPLRSYFRWS